VGQRISVARPFQLPLTLECAPGFTVGAVTQTISAQAAALGVSPDTLRYYEQLGLLPPPPRTAAGYRMYDEDAAERIRFISGAKRMGLRLADIKELLDVRDRGQCPCGHTRSLVERRLAEVEAEIQQLSALRGQLLALKQRTEECFDSAAGDWSCVVVSEKGGGA
jgi:DNA-binding transcriptional MerR regulator